MVFACLAVLLIYRFHVSFYFVRPSDPVCSKSSELASSYLWLCLSLVRPQP